MSRHLWFLLLLLFACGRKDPDSGKKVFHYNEASGIPTLDPAFARDQSIIWPSLQLFNGLVQLDDHLNVIPCIAYRWTISEDGRNYMFHLRDDVYFHRNACFRTSDSTRKVVASDFVFSLQRLASPTLAAPGSWVLNEVGRLNGDSLDISAPDDSTLLITLKKSFPPFLSLLSNVYCSVIPAEAIAYYGPEFRSHPVGSGPFRFSYWKEGVRLILLKNEDYFEYEHGRRLPHLDAVEVSFINDKQSAFIEFLKGKLDFLSGIDGSYKDDLLTRSGELQQKYVGKFEMETEPYLNTEYLGILMDREGVLSDRRIRQALSYGFDRKQMIQFLRNNMGTPGNYGMVPPGLPSFDSTAIAYVYDPGKAAGLLADAGYPQGKGLPEIVLNTTTTYLDLCEFIRSQWEKLGMKIKIDVNQAAVHRKLIAEQKINFFRGSWIADYPDAENYLSLFYSANFAPGGPNYTHYSNSEFDRLFLEAIRESGDSLRYDLYRRMDKLIMNDAPVIILYYDKVVRLYANGITGLSPNAMNLLFLKKVNFIRDSITTNPL